MRLIKRGAEAELYLTDFLGREAVLKRRIPKKYRIPELDRKIRAERTRAEARIIHRAKKAGVRTPILYSIDVKNTEITMEKMKGFTLKHALPSMNEDEKREIGKKIGEMVAKLHSAGIVHGDLTTSNMILSDAEIALIDFGLSEISSEKEMMASDLRVLKEGWKSAHYRDEDVLEIILENYRNLWDSGKEVMETLEKMEGRRRYVRRN